MRTNPDSWPPGDGEMAGRIREFDWDQTPVGPIASWSADRKVATNLMLAQGNPTSLIFRAGRTLIYNDAYASMIGARHPQVLGVDAALAFPEVAFNTYLDRALDGETVTLEDEAMPFIRQHVMGQAWFDISYTPVRFEAGAVGTVMVSIKETTARVLARVARDEADARQEFLLRLSDALRPLTDPLAIEHRAATLLGQHLAVSRAFYFSLRHDADGYVHVVERDYFARPDLPSLVGDHPYRAYGQELLAGLAKGRPSIMPDIQSATDIGAESQALFAAGQIRAWIAVPLIKNDAYIAGLVVIHDQPRNWTSLEVSLVEDVAERTWASVERARSEVALGESEERVRMALEAGRMGTWRYDLATGQQQWNEQQFRLYGLEPGSHPPSRDLFLSMVHPDDIHLIEFGPQDLVLGRGFLDAEFRVVRPDGEIRWLVAHTIVARDTAGKPTEMIGLNWDITDRKRGEEALRTSEERFRQFGEASLDVLWIREAETLRWVYLTPAFETIYGLKREDALGVHDFRTWTELIVSEDRALAIASIERVRQGENVAFEYRIRRPTDGHVVWLRNTDFPIFDDSGRVSLIGGIGHDITPIKRGEEHQRFLLSELQHRVRNTLAVIRSITRRTAETTDTKDDFFMHLDGRIDSFARVQAAVTRDPAKGVDLAFLVAEELRIVGAREGQGLRIAGPAVDLAPKAAEILGLAIHELATNAMKYGALSNARGNIRVSWEIVGDDAGRMLDFQWEEKGVHHMPQEPRRRGFGTEILERSLAYELKAETDIAFRDEGLNCHIVVPLERLNARTGASGVLAW